MFTLIQGYLDILAILNALIKTLDPFDQGFCFLEDSYRDKVLQDNLCHYDDVDRIDELAFELFVDDYQLTI